MPRGNAGSPATDVDGDAALNADEVRATRQGRFGHDRSDHDESDN